MTQTLPSDSAADRVGSPEAGSPAASKGPATDIRRGWVLFTVLTGQFMALLDIFIVNVAAPTIRTDLGASGGGLQMILAGYTISYAVLLITGARLGARFGHGRLFLQGLVVFTLASLACGLAGDSGQLIAFRFVQGAGASLMMPQVLSLIQRTFTGPSRARALGAFAAVIATGAAAGQIIGGVLVSADLFGTGWRPAFLVNVPIGAFLLILGTRVLPREEKAARTEDRARGLDVTGLLLLAAAVGLLTVPLVLGEERDWPLWCWLSLAASTVLLAVFAFYEQRLARRGGAPLISPKVLRAPGIPLAVLRIGLVMALNAGVLFALSLHLQTGLDYSAWRTGVTFLPTAIAFGTVGMLWQRLPERLLRLAVPGGFVLAAVSYAAMGELLRDGGDGGVWLYAAFLGVGAGLGFGYGPTLTRALGSVRPQEAADASGLLTTVTQLGMLLGVATLGTLYLNRLEATGSSSEAIGTTSLALALTAVLGAVGGLVRRRV
ncbi:MFS transporter [Streptomyces sp. N2-109]|uniref:MFS transporter n=1 Tax=Streptomyces gossypii TaxID=2883101 RepID=A0ABT2JSS5_9ACTN|nr:MFS transporter [Streptomyces gossypii]MCT2590410.1 MFS transporter [Streptomyces gossypii]